MSNPQISQFLQAVLTSSEEIAVIFAGHVPESEIQEIAERLYEYGLTLDGLPNANAHKAVVAGALLGLGIEDFDNLA